MATISFRIRSKSNIVPIYVNLSNGVNNFYEAKTIFSIKYTDWSTKTKMPKQTIDINKKITIELENLKKHIYEQIIEAQTNNNVINKLWFKNTINNYFGKTTNIHQTDSNIVVNHLIRMINNASIKKVNGRNEIGLSKNTIKAYKSFLKLIMKYENEGLKKTIKFTDINKIFIENLNNWLFNEMQYSTNYVGKINQFLKTVCYDAKKSEIKVNSYIDYIERFTEKNSERNIVTLSFGELELIKQTKFENEYLENARKWILIGCAIGQRGDDLLNITTKNLRFDDELLLIDVYQSKTKKNVVCPIIDTYIKELLINEFPHKISIQKLNEYIKTVCEQIGINELCKGKKTSKMNEIKGKSNLRRVKGLYPKYELITSHCFRRSFATNYYKKIATPIIMAITGHTKESQFLQYINRNEDKDENARLFVKQYSLINFQ